MNTPTLDDYYEPYTFDYQAVFNRWPKPTCFNRHRRIGEDQPYNNCTLSFICYIKEGLIDWEDERNACNHL